MLEAQGLSKSSKTLLIISYIIKKINTFQLNLNAYVNKIFKKKSIYKYNISCYNIIANEVWLSLVERYVRDVEAAGSNPVTSIFLKPPDYV